MVSQLLTTEDFSGVPSEDYHQLTCVGADGVASSWLLRDQVAASVAKKLRSCGYRVRVLPPSPGNATT